MTLKEVMTMIEKINEMGKPIGKPLYAVMFRDIEPQTITSHLVRTWADLQEVIECEYDEECANAILASDAFNCACNVTIPYETYEGHTKYKSFCLDYFPERKKVSR